MNLDLLEECQCDNVKTCEDCNQYDNGSCGYGEVCEDWEPIE